MEKNVIDWITMVLVIVGGLNWGLVGLFGFDLVAAIFGNMSILSRLRETAPRMTIIRVTIIVNIGRLTLNLGKFIASEPYLSEPFID